MNTIKINNTNHETFTITFECIAELKKLQKEIDEAEAQRDRLTQTSLMVTPPHDIWQKLYTTIEQNQQRIKEIIESL